MLFLPLSKKLEGKGVNRGFAAVISIFIILLFFALVIGMVVWQVQDLAKDKDKVQQQITQKIELLKKAVDKKLGISPKKQEEMLKEQQQSSKGNIGQTGSKIFTSLFSFL
jgi:predicted PurR-regulated permease PerM